MANFNYDPGVQDRRGEIMAQGLSQAFAAVSQKIQQQVDTHNRVKEKRALAERYNTMLGGDPGSVKKMKEPDLDAFNTVAPALVTQQNQTRAGQNISRFVQSYYNNRQTGPTGAPAAGTPFNAAGAIPTQRQPLSPPDAAARALAGNPALFNYPRSTSAAMNIAKVLGTMGSSGVSIDPATGLPILRSGNSTRVINPAWLAPKAPKPAPTLDFTTDPKGNEFWTYGNRGGQTRPPQDNTHRGELPPNFPTQVINGKTFAVLPDGWMKPLPGDGQDPVMRLIQGDAEGNFTPDAKPTEGNEDNEAKPAANEPDPHDPLNLGINYGEIFHGAGDTWQPAEKATNDSAPPPTASPADGSQVEAEDKELSKLKDYIQWLGEQNEAALAPNLAAAKARADWLETIPAQRKGTEPPSPIPWDWWD